MQYHHGQVTQPEELSTIVLVCKEEDQHVTFGLAERVD
jgi:hypothetical protein